MLWLTTPGYIPGRLGTFFGKAVPFEPGKNYMGFANFPFTGTETWEEFAERMRSPAGRTQVLGFLGQIPGMATEQTAPIGVTITALGFLVLRPDERPHPDLFGVRVAQFVSTVAVTGLEIDAALSGAPESEVYDLFAPWPVEGLGSPPYALISEAAATKGNIWEV